MARILIVDDNRASRLALRHYLEEGGHKVDEAESGEAALAVAASTPPDLVTTDVVMPGMDGYEVTRRLKAQSRDAPLPVILVSSHQDRDARLAGYRAGADELLIKPFDREELLLRVGNLVALRAEKLALLRRNVEIMELHRFRDEMASLLVHDLKNPMSVVMSNLEYVVSAGGLSADFTDALDDSLAAGRQVLRLVDGLLEMTRLENNRVGLRRTKGSLRALLAEVLGPRTSLARRREITIDNAVAAELTATIDHDLVVRQFENVVDNALRYVQTGGRIRVWAEAGEGMVTVRFGNSGPPIPLDARRVVFERFGQAHSSVGRMNLGLGLYFCRLVAEVHDGRIWIEQHEDLPTVFAVMLPG